MAKKKTIEKEKPKEYILTDDELLDCGEEGTLFTTVLGVVGIIGTIILSIYLLEKSIIGAFGVLAYVIAGTEITSYFVVKHYTNGWNYTGINKIGTLILKLSSVFWCAVGSVVTIIAIIILIVIVKIIIDIIKYVNLNIQTTIYYFLSVALIMVLLVIVFELNHKRFNKQIQKQKKKK